MKQVKIVSGIYGYRPPNSKQIKPARAGDVISVSKEEAARLVELGVAVSVENVSVAPTEENKALNIASEENSAVNSPVG